MENNNPYETPEGDLDTYNGEYCEVKILSGAGRIGRIRYLAHAMLLTLAAYALMIPGFVFVTMDMAAFGGLLIAVAYIGMIVVIVMNGRQRLHDLNKSGWFMLLFLVPLANFILALYMLFAPGDDGPNDYGNPPPPNKTWHWVVGLGLMVVPFILGILAAIALPAYQDYQDRANNAQMYQE